MSEHNWKDIPGLKGKYQCREELDKKGIPMVRSVTKAAPTPFNNSKMTRIVKGNVISVNVTGRYKLTRYNGAKVTLMPQDIWSATFKGTELIPMTHNRNKGK